MGVPITPRHAIGIRDPSVKDCRLPGFPKAMDSDVVLFRESRLVWMNGSSETAKGFRARAHISLHSAATSSWRCRMRPLFGHCWAWLKTNFFSHLLHVEGSLRGASPNLSRRLSRNSSSVRTVPLRVLGRLLSHAPVSLALTMRREACWSSALHNVLRAERPRSAFVLRIRARAF